MDQKKLAALRERYAEQSGAQIYDPEFRAVAEGQFQGERRK